MSILEEILARKRAEVAQAKARVAPDDLAAAAEACGEAARGFRAALTRGSRPRIVAEMKPRSPSRGVIRADFDPVSCAKAYFDGGAAAISVLTDHHFFGGGLDLLEIVRRVVPLPLLRKDFLLDRYQIDEARVAGADAILLIVAAFPSADAVAEIRCLRDRAFELGLDALVEAHDEREFDIALECGADLIGVNNRDLGTFEVDLEVSERLAGRARRGVVVVAESGIFTADDVERLESSGVDAFLVGEALMREPNPGLALRELRRKS